MEFNVLVKYSTVSLLIGLLASCSIYLPKPSNIDWTQLPSSADKGVTRETLDNIYDLAGFTDHQIENIAVNYTVTSHGNVLFKLNDQFFIGQQNNGCLFRFKTFFVSKTITPPSDYTHGGRTVLAYLEKQTVSITNSGDVMIKSKPEYLELYEGPLLGKGHFAFQSGDFMVDCGDKEFRWYYPTWISFDQKDGVSLYKTNNFSNIDKFTKLIPQLYSVH